MSTIGKIILDLAPGADNPRNSEGAFLDLKDGRILFVYSRYTGDDGEDYAPSDIAARYSSDGGETWSSEDRILFRKEEFDAMNIMSVSLLRMENDDIGLFFFVLSKDGLQGHLHLLRSSDEGETWTKAEDAVNCVPAVGWYNTNNDRVIRTHTGRLIVPANLHRVHILPNGLFKYDNFGTGCFFYSDDDGRTWTEAADCCYPPSNKIPGALEETGVIELENHVLWAYFRTGGGCYYQSYSFDDGIHWTDAMPSRFTGPRSPLCMKRLSDGRILAVWNPLPCYNGRTGTTVSGFGGRTPYVAAVSGDEGKTWSREFYLEDGSEDAGYCYCAIHPQKDSVLLAYCAGNSADGGCLNRLRIRKVLLDELQS